MITPLTKAELHALVAAALPGAELALRDDSAKHAGHAGSGGGGGHYTLTAVWAGFAGLNRLARQRRIHEILRVPLQAGRIHALQLSLHTPDEAA